MSLIARFDKEQDGPSLESSSYLNVSLRYLGPWDLGTLGHWDIWYGLIMGVGGGGVGGESCDIGEWNWRWTFDLYIDLKKIAREIHVYTCVCTWITCVYTCYTPWNGLDVCHPQEPPVWPLTHLWVTFQSKVTIREILSLKPHEYTWNIHVSQLKIV